MTDFVEKEIDNLDEEQSFEDSENVQEYYDKLTLMFESMKTDVVKSNKGNKAAGVRLRKTARAFKKEMGNFVKFTLSK